MIIENKYRQHMGYDSRGGYWFGRKEGYRRGMKRGIIVGVLLAYLFLMVIMLMHGCI